MIEGVGFWMRGTWAGIALGESTEWPDTTGRVKRESVVTEVRNPWMIKDLPVAGNGVIREKFRLS